MERRFQELDIELRESEQEGVIAEISGHAAVFYRSDDPGTQYEMFSDTLERIDRGAFRNGLSTGEDVRGLFNHDPSQVLGRTAAGTMRLSTDKIGLKYQIDVPDTTVGRDLVTSMRRGDVSGSSFGFRASNVDWSRDGDKTVRTIKEAKLFDAGPVTYPAYAAADAGFRSRCFAEAKEEYEQWTDQAANEEKVQRERIERIAARQRRVRELRLQCCR